VLTPSWHPAHPAMPGVSAGPRPQVRPATSRHTTLYTPWHVQPSSGMRQLRASMRVPPILGCAAGT
jgi:hypothetical protein